MGADDHIDAGHGRGYANILAVRETTVLAFFHAAMAERDDHVHLLSLAEHLHHFAGGLDGIGELGRAGATGIELRFLAEQSEDAKAHAAALDHDVAADHSVLGQLLEASQRRIAGAEIGVRCDHHWDVTSLGGHRDRLGRTVRPEVKIMVAEGRGVATDPGQELKFATGLTRSGGERGPHAVVARIKHQHGTLTRARRFPLRDQSGQTRKPASGFVVVERERVVVRSWRHPDQIGVEVVGVQNGQGFLPVRCSGVVLHARRPSHRSPTEPANTSRREGAFFDIPIFVPFSVLACFTITGLFMALAFRFAAHAWGLAVGVEKYLRLISR